MRALLQRVSRAAVSVDGREIAAIDHGLLVLLGVFRDDHERLATRLAERTLAARIFADDAHGYADTTRSRASKPMNRSVLDVGGGVLAVSQFTLAADTGRGNRPSFGDAAPPEVALPLYESYVAGLRTGCEQVETGAFGAEMRVALVNDGPVTVLLEAN
ncbi:MAG: D-aminoacyl-tRNA deacylase [Gammaproteobacteria bacterium]|nr:D-aminoacyl-tRNA deacylase [Gammaproteobacteria bacterium]